MKSEEPVEPPATGSTAVASPGPIAPRAEPLPQPASTATAGIAAGTSAPTTPPAAAPAAPPGATTTPPTTAPEPRKIEKPEPPTEAKRPAIDIAATRAAARSQLGPIQQCYERARMDDASLKGNVTAQITVAADGSIANVRIVSTTLSSPPTERCITAEIARWQLPKPSGGAAVSFTYPFVFE
jgi:hypothetical protein